MANKLINLSFSIAVGALVLSIIVTPAAAVKKASSPFIQGPVPETDNLILPPEPHPGYYKGIEICLKNISGECGEQIYLGIFKDHVSISGRCCYDLVGIGSKCHRRIVLNSLRLLRHKPTKDETEKILYKSYSVWSNCVDSSLRVDPHDLPPASTPALIL